MTDYTKLVDNLRDIEKTMFALGTSPINMDNVSIRLAYDKRWVGQTANDAADVIEHLLHERNEARETASYWMKQTEYANAQLKMYSMCPFDDEEDE